MNKISINPLPFYRSSFEPDTITEEYQGIVFTKNEIILDKDGLDKYKEKHNLKFTDTDNLHEGRFVGFFEKANSYVCKTDYFGQELLFYYKDSSNWAISNSFLYLTEKLKENGVKLSIYEPALQSFMAGNQSLFGGQLLSFRTGVEEIRLLPHDKEIVIEKPELNSLKISNQKLNIEPITNEEQYKDGLVSYIQAWSSRLKILSSMNFVDKVLELSGGYDTRVNLALLLATESKDVLENIEIITDKRKADDLASVNKISKNLNIIVKEASTLPNYSKVATAQQEYMLWSYGSAGVYLPIYRMRSQAHTNVLKIHGANYRGRSYIKTPAIRKAESLTNDLPKKTASNVKDVFLGSFDELGVRPEDSNAMQQHYMAFRCRVHYGRNWHWRFRNLFVTPQLSLNLKKLTDWKELTGESAEQVTSDILYTVSPELTQIPFDTPDKKFSDETVGRSKKLGININIQHRQKIDFLGHVKKPRPSKVTDKNNDLEFAELLLEKFQHGLKNKKIKKLFGRKFIKQAKQQKKGKSMLKKGKISAVVAAYEIIKLTE